MKALILVGGYGTRLRPLTLTVPKPLVEFCNVPMVVRQIQRLVEVGVDEVVLAVNYRSDFMKMRLDEECKNMNVKITFSLEEEPLGTAGPLALARDILASSDDPFFVLNADVVCDFPFKDLLTFHKARGAEGTLMVTQVQDPSKYGVVVHDEDGRIQSFIEKPKVWVGDRINAGIYCLSPSVLDRIKPVPTSIEKDVFPKIAADGALYAMDLKGFWMDVGQPPDFILGTQLYLSFLQDKRPEDLTMPAAASSSSSSSEIIQPCMIHPTAQIGNGCKIGPHVVIGPNVKIADCVQLKNCTILEDTVIESAAVVNDGIVGWKSRLGRWTRLQNLCVIGEDVNVKPDILLNKTVVLPHKTVKDSRVEPGQVIL